MKAVNINTEEASVKWWAARDAHMKSLANATHYSDDDKLRAERMKYLLELAYSAEGVYIAYGKKGISIKLNKARVKNETMLKAAEQIWDEEGVTKKVSAQGVIYRFTA
mgnify:CR=1 FL=1